MKNKVILCGSMKVKDKIIEVKEILENKGFLVILPEECFKDELEGWGVIPLNGDLNKLGEI